MEELSEHNKERLTNSPNEDIWKAVSENNLAYAVELIKTKLQFLSPKRNFLERFMGKPKIKGDKTLHFALEILEQQNLPNSKSLTITLKNSGDLAFAELVRFLTALSLNGSLRVCYAVAEVALNNLENLANEVQDGAGDYPNSSINASVWMGGMVIREWAENLAEFFYRENLSEQETKTRFFKCKITNSIMAHYHHLVGPDMIAAAKCYEKINQDEMAKNGFTAVVMDFEQFIDYYKNDEIPNEEDYYSLISLLEAYKGLTRIKKIDYSEKTQMVESILQRINQSIP